MKTINLTNLYGYLRSGVGTIAEKQAELKSDYQEHLTNGLGILVGLWTIIAIICHKHLGWSFFFTGAVGILPVWLLARWYATMMMSETSKEVILRFSLDPGRPPSPLIWTEAKPMHGYVSRIELRVHRFGARWYIIEHNPDARVLYSVTQEAETWHSILIDSAEEFRLVSDYDSAPAGVIGGIDLTVQERQRFSRDKHRLTKQYTWWIRTEEELDWVQRLLRQVQVPSGAEDQS